MLYILIQQHLTIQMT